MDHHVASHPNTSASSWEAWLDEQGELFFLYARQQTRSEFDAKDVLQDALTEVWLKAEGFIPDKAHVFSTIRRRAIDLGRSITRRSAREENYAGDQLTWFTPLTGSETTNNSSNLRNEIRNRTANPQTQAWITPY